MAGHVARMEDKRWTKRILNWRPYDHKRPIGKPPTRGDDDIKRYLTESGRITYKIWQQIANDRGKWRDLIEAYLRFRIK